MAETEHESVLLTLRPVYILRRCSYPEYNTVSWERREGRKKERRIREKGKKKEENERKEGGSEGRKEGKKLGGGQS